ncbi:hypothetical protein LTR56_004717 [Elasticomyces elasticus]|nr:hypothetical protein LTR56_004717 [Elasticomyces elasticus]KAK3665572.1 hypothetical protein LTR22_003512 [Elasticomyces elasticus]KAK4930390.1 hypothetical protein LTR49_003131 [Elasticomyces elasticus]KAK5768883.1 hypothetical protein LTS12_000943 [Elasticomyces elasticus]
MGERWFRLPHSRDQGEHVDATPVPFFELSRELRDRIYQMEFQYPQSGLFFSSPATKKPIVRSRDLEDDSSFDDITQDHETRSHILETQQCHISCLRCSSVVNMPLFYSLNSFNFGCQRTMSTVIVRLPRASREHVRSVGVRYDPRTTYTTNVTRGVRYDEVWFRSLERLPGVKKLEILFITKDWNSMAHVTGWPGLSYLRGFNVLVDIVVKLREIGEVDVCVVGCPALQEIL